MKESIFIVACTKCGYVPEPTVKSKGCNEVENKPCIKCGAEIAPMLRTDWKELIKLSPTTSNGKEK